MQRFFGLYLLSFFACAACTSKDASHHAPLDITHLSWGKIEITQGKNSHMYKDVILTPHEAVSWDWSKTGMGHRPGIRICDVEPLLNQGDVFILSRGMDCVLQVTKEAVEYLKNHGKKVHVLQTEEAVKMYSVCLASHKKVVAFLHSTC